jgi:hypothetical protein
MTNAKQKCGLSRAAFGRLDVSPCPSNSSAPVMRMPPPAGISLPLADGTGCFPIFGSRSAKDARFAGASGGATRWTISHIA